MKSILGFIIVSLIFVGCTHLKVVNYDSETYCFDRVTRMLPEETITLFPNENQFVLLNCAGGTILTIIGRMQCCSDSIFFYPQAIVESNGCRIYMDTIGDDRTALTLDFKGRRLSDGNLEIITDHTPILRNILPDIGDSIMVKSFWDERIAKSLFRRSICRVKR